MKIVHIAKVDIKGGAARAAYRLHQGLCELNRELGRDRGQEMAYESHMLVRHKHSSDDTVWSVIPEAETVPLQVTQAVAVQNYAINANRTDLSNTPFTLPYPGLDLSTLDLIQSADIIHWHWLVEFQSLTTLHRLLQLGKPVVWTLHDMWPFTGGCHSSAGCTQYQTGCQSCPQLHSDVHALPAAILRDKQELLSHPNLTLVAPSQKMADQARSSLLFRNSPIQVVHHSIETTLFFPIAKSEAKQQLGIAPEILTLAYGSEDCGQRSKGFVELDAVMQQCLQNEKFQTLVAEKKICLVGFGRGSEAIASLPLPTLNSGYIQSDDQLRTVYSAADVFLQPSLEESFGNMAIEALCCGTPVIAFDVGVAPEIIQPHELGRVIPLGDTHQMAIALLDVIQRPEHWHALSLRCHEQTSTEFAQHIQAQRHITLYHSTLSVSPSRPLLHSPTPNASGDAPRALPPPTTPPSSLPAPYSLHLSPNLQPLFPSLALDSMSKALADQHERSPQLRHVREKLKLTRTQMVDLELQLQYTQRELQQIQHELNQAQAEIAAIKRSKLWKIRTLWHTLKSRFT